MGISIEQYRSRTGSQDNFVKTKDISSRFKDRFLEFNAFDVPFKCVSLASFETTGKYPIPAPYVPLTMKKSLSINKVQSYCA